MSRSIHVAARPPRSRRTTLRAVSLSAVLHAAVLVMLWSTASGGEPGSGSTDVILTAIASLPNDEFSEPVDCDATLESPPTFEAMEGPPLCDAVVSEAEPPDVEIPFLDDASPSVRSFEGTVPVLTLTADAVRPRGGRRHRRLPAPAAPPARRPILPSPPTAVSTQQRPSTARPGRRGGRTARRTAAVLRIVHVPDVRDYYPRRALRQGVQGVVLVEVEIDQRGLVVSARVVRSSGSGTLDAAGLRLARDVRFARGERARRRAHLPVVFNLQ